MRQTLPPEATTASLQSFPRKGSCFSLNFPPQFHNSNMVLCELTQRLLEMPGMAASLQRRRVHIPLGVRNMIGICMLCDAHEKERTRPSLTVL